MPYAQPILMALPKQAPQQPFCLGQVVELTPAGQLLVQLADSEGPPIPARLAAPHSRETVLAAIAQQHSAVIARLQGCEEAVVLSFLLPAEALAAEAPPATIVQTPGKLTLQVGPATISLHDSGRIELKGVRIVSQADADYRIMGRSVHIN